MFRKGLNKPSDAPTRAGTMCRTALQVIAELAVLPVDKGTDSDGRLHSDNCAFGGIGVQDINQRLVTYVGYTLHVSGYRTMHILPVSIIYILHVSVYRNIHILHVSSYGN